MKEFASDTCRPIRLETSMECGVETTVDALILPSGALIRTIVSWRTNTVRAGSSDSPIAVATTWIPGATKQTFDLE